MTDREQRALVLAETWRAAAERARADALALRAELDSALMREAALRRQYGAVVKSVADRRPTVDQVWFSPSQAARVLGVGRRTVYNWIQAGAIRTHPTPGKAGAMRIHISQLDLARRDLGATG